MISVIIKGGNPLNPIITFDAELSEKITEEIEWSKYAIETQANVADFGWVKPTVYVITGQITSSPLGGIFRISRLTEIKKQIRDAAKRRQLVTLISETIVEDAVITLVDFERGVDEGESFLCEIDLQSILRPTVETVNIDPSRLKNRRKSTRLTRAQHEAILNDDAKFTNGQDVMRGPQPTVVENTTVTYSVVP